MQAPRWANPPAVPTLNIRSGSPMEDRDAYVETLAAVVATLFPPNRSSLEITLNDISRSQKGYDKFNFLVKKC